MEYNDKILNKKQKSNPNIWFISMVKYIKNNKISIKNLKLDHFKKCKNSRINEK
jgi:hypothetical protein